MAIADETTMRIVLYEGEGAASLEAPDRTATVAALLEQGYAVTCAGEGAVAPADDSSLLVLGRFADGKAPEAEDAAGNVSLAFRDITGLDPEVSPLSLKRSANPPSPPSTANGNRGFR